jgi:hypothetical protein
MVHEFMWRRNMNACALSITRKASRQETRKVIEHWECRISRQAEPHLAPPNLIDLRVSQMTSNVQLIEALGGGWDVNQLPSEKQVAAT